MKLKNIIVDKREIAFYYLVSYLLKLVVMFTASNHYMNSYQVSFWYYAIFVMMSMELGTFFYTRMFKDTYMVYNPNGGKRGIPSIFYVTILGGIAIIAVLTAKISPSLMDNPFVENVMPFFFFIGALISKFTILLFLKRKNSRDQKYGIDIN
jgi:hypothetical protein